MPLSFARALSLCLRWKDFRANPLLWSWVKTTLWNNRLALVRSPASDKPLTLESHLWCRKLISEGGQVLTILRSFTYSLTILEVLLRSRRLSDKWGGQFWSQPPRKRNSSVCLGWSCDFYAGLDGWLTSDWKHGWLSDPLASKTGDSVVVRESYPYTDQLIISAYSYTILFIFCG